MIVSALLLMSLGSLPTPPSAAPRADPSVAYARTIEHRQARLMEGMELDATFRLSESPPMRILDPLRLSLQGAPGPLDDGGGVDAETRQIVALLLGLIVGFGTGHLVARDRDGFVLFLLVDIAIIVVGSVFRVAFGHGLYLGLGGLALLVSHVIQALDAYAEAGGARIVEHTRQKALWVSQTGGGHAPAAITTRALAFGF